MVDRSDARVDERRCAQVCTESVVTWGEAVAADLTHDTARALAADVTYRIRQTLHVCGQFLRHAKRRRLTPDDVNRSLKWMDVPAVLGHTGSEAAEWVGVGEVGVHVPHDPSVNLASTALSGDIFHQPGSPCVRGEWVQVSGHTMVKGEGEEATPAHTTLSEPHLHYYKTLLKVLTGPSNDLFKIMSEDVSKNPAVGAIVGPVVGGLVRATQRARQKPRVLRRILVLVRSLLANTHLHLGPKNYMRDIVNVLVYCIIFERSQDTHTIRSLASNVALQVVSRQPGSRLAWETTVSNLGGVVASSSCPWGQHVGALTGLLVLGVPALLHTLTPIARAYHLRLVHAMSQSSLATPRDAHDAHVAKCLLLAGLVRVMSAFVRSLPAHMTITPPPKTPPGLKHESGGDFTTPASIGEVDVSFEQMREIYRMGEESYGSAFVVQIPSVYLCLERQNVPSFLTSSVYRDQAISGDALLNPPPTKKPRHAHKTPRPRRSTPTSPQMVFEGYKPVGSGVVGMVIRDGWTKGVDGLRRKRLTLPRAANHPHRSLLVRYSRVTGCMPHNTYTRPLHPPLRPGYTLQHMLL